MNEQILNLHKIINLSSQRGTVTKLIDRVIYGPNDVSIVHIQRKMCVFCSRIRLPSLLCNKSSH